MKKLNQKQWGVLGTSLGSMLIIVALLAMVGIGSGNTYASAVAGGDEGGGKTSSSSSPSPASPSPASPSSEPQFYCSPGTYHRDHSVCITCPAGYYCPGGNFDYYGQMEGKHACPTGTISGTGQSECTAAPTCPAGEYRAAGDCVTCPQGSYCPGGSDSTRHDCPDGTTSGTNSTSITDCKSSGTTNSCTNKTKGATCLTSDGKTGTCQDSGSVSGGRICKANPSSGSSSTTCAAGTYYDGNNSCLQCTSGFHCPGGTFSHTTGDINGSGRKTCPKDKPYSQAGAKAESECTASGNGGTGGNTGGNTGGTGGNGGNTGGTGGNGGNTGGNTGGNNGGSNTSGGNNGGNNSNTNTNPSTATKTPLVIVVIGMIAMGLGTFTYYKSKNNEI